MSDKKSFWEWYNETEKVAGSLVTPASAAKMLGVTRQYIEKLVAVNKLTKYYYDDLPFIGMNEINKELARRKTKEKQKNDPNILYLKAQKEKLLEEIQKEEEKRYQDQIEIHEGKREEEDKALQILLEQKKLEEEIEELNLQLGMIKSGL